MTAENRIQEKMYREIADSSLFQKAVSYGQQYLDQVFDRHVYPTQEAMERLGIFDEDMPASHSEAAQVLELLHEFGAPSAVSHVGGRYFGFVTGSVAPAGLVAKLLSTFWDQNAALQALSPISARLELVVENWFKQIFNLPHSTVAGFVSGSSVATFCGLAAARYRQLKRLGWDVNQQGLFGAPPLRVVTGRQAHSTVLKAIGLLGFGKENIEWVEVDQQGRILLEQVPELDESTILVLQAGNVNSGAFDPFEEICAKARQAKAWVHIDGAFGLWAAAAQELQHLTRGMALANSWSVDGHKTLNTPYDCGVILCEDEEALVSAFHMTGSYIMLGEARDGMFYTPEMSRRARVIELWATMKYLGLEGIDQMVSGFHQRALQFAEELRQNDFEILNDVVFNQVLVSCGADELTEKTLENIQAERECWVGGSEWFGKPVIRISVSSWATTAEDVSRSVRSFVSARDQALSPK